MTQAPETTFHPYIAQNREVGAASRRVVGSVAAVGLVLAGAGIFAYNKFTSALPHGEGSAPGSYIDARQLTLDTENLSCLTLSTYDVGSDPETNPPRYNSAQTRYTIGDKTFTFLGFGSIMKTGKVVKEACADQADGGITVSDQKRSDGHDIKHVAVKVSRITFDTHMNAADTLIVQSPPPASQVLGGVIDVGSGSAVAVCQGLANNPLKPYDAKSCNNLNVLATWKNEQQATLDAALTVAVLNEVQRGCGRAGWNTERLAFTDALKQQAVEQGANPADVVVDFVDDKGNTTESVPNFKKSKLDSLYANGTLNTTVSGSPELIFDRQTCHPLTSYTPKFKNN